MKIQFDNLKMIFLHQIHRDRQRLHDLLPRILHVHRRLHDLPLRILRVHLEN